MEPSAGDAGLAPEASRPPAGYAVYLVPPGLAPLTSRGASPARANRAVRGHHVGMHLLATIAILLSGLQGTVTKGPTRPVCRQGEPCSAPAQVTLLFRRAGHTTRARSTATGRYRALLAPGYYTVSTVERIGITPNIRPQRVHVRAGHVDRLDFSIDTGIR